MTEGQSNPVVSSLIVKLTSRCNLDCDYCYIYHGRDASWRSMPYRMSPETIDGLVNCVEHLYEVQPEGPLVAFHGGEPLLFGVREFGALVERMSSSIENPRLTIQSNGTIYNDSLGKILRQNRRHITFSVSVDGFQRHNDKHRLDKRGRSHFSRIEKTIVSARDSELLESALMVVDTTNHPSEIFDFMLWAGARSYDLLLQDGDYDNLPPGKRSIESTETAQWLLDFSNIYFSAPRKFKVRVLDDMLQHLLLEKHGLRALPRKSSTVDLTIDTNGQIKLVDTLRVNCAGADFAGQTMVSAAGVAFVLSSKEVSDYLLHCENVSDKCNGCRYFAMCGGGYIQHRWGNGSYKNPSVYCADYLHIFRAMEKAVTRHTHDLPAHRQSS